MGLENFQNDDWQHLSISDIISLSYGFGQYFVIIFITLLGIILAVGRPITRQANPIRIAAMAALATTVGVYPQLADLGFSFAIVIALVLVFIHSFIMRSTAQPFRQDQASLLDIALLVEDSKLNFPGMQSAGVTRASVFAQLRAVNIRHLGEVKILYLEANGRFILILRQKQIPGLSVLSDLDQEYDQEVNSTAKNWVCQNCGQDRGYQQLAQCCENCNSATFTRAVE